LTDFTKAIELNHNYEVYYTRLTYHGLSYNQYPSPITPGDPDRSRMEYPYYGRALVYAVKGKKRRPSPTTGDSWR
jgi:hypothetical protein